MLGERDEYLLIDPQTHECLTVHPAQVQLYAQHFLMRFSEFTAPEPLKRVCGWDLAFGVRRGELPRDADEIYFFELQGMEVRDAGGQVLGHVAEVRDSGAHVLLELDTQPPRLVPFIRQFVPEVSLDEGWLICTYPLAAAEVAP
jgi:16S rRNA processing protein RimM